MDVRRARKFVGATSLLLVSGCVALSGLGDLSVGGDELVPDSAAPDANVTTTTVPDAHVVPIAEAGGDADAGSTPTDDGSTPKDTGAPDVLPDAGGGNPDSGTVVTASVQCSASLTCSGQTPVCCVSSILGEAAHCVAKGKACDTANSAGFACDDDFDCAGGKVCCYSPGLFGFNQISACAVSCAAGTQHACRSSDECGPAADGDAGTCKSAAFSPLMTCQ